MRFLIIFIFLITNVVAEELPGIKNIIIHKIPKTHDNVIFLDKNDQKININEYIGNLLICLLYTSPSPRDLSTSRMPSSA